MKNSNFLNRGLKIESRPKNDLNNRLRVNKSITSTGTCLGECVKCGASCCMDAGHPGPHFCYLCM